MRFFLVSFGAACTLAVFGGCALSPSSVNPTNVSRIAQPTAGNHPPAIDITYKNQHPPQYPFSAVVAHHQGLVVLDVVVNAQNQVADVTIEKSSSYPELDAAAVAAARNWRFAAGVKNGKPYASVIRVPVTFSM